MQCSGNGATKGRDPAAAAKPPLCEARGPAWKHPRDRRVPQARAAHRRRVHKSVPVAGPPRYVSCVRYNPRGTGDQYEGITERAAIFFSGDITQFIKSTPELCGGNVVYQRFPELEKLVP